MSKGRKTLLLAVAVTGAVLTGTASTVISGSEVHMGGHFGNLGTENFRTSAKGKSVKMLIRGAVATLMVGIAGLFPASQAEAAVSCVNRGAALASGGALLRGECLQSSNGRYKLVMQYDGNLVLYNNNGSPCWSSSRELGGKYYAGDTAFVTVVSIVPNYSETSLVLKKGSPWTGSPNRWFVTFGDTRVPGVERTYNVSVNNSGELWVGWDEYRSC